tara:strand:+ start:247 stop:897 length:651 start_codon:yes stop_codon:yes gene_type:complete
MPGIEDLMNIRTQGGTANAPPMPPPGMGGPPPGMGGPPPGMGGPPPGMGGPPPGMGGPPPGMGGGMGGPPPEEASSIESDSALLAEAVVDRTQGNVEAAIAVLDNAKSMLIASINEQPPGMGGPPPEMGGPPPEMGGPPMNAAYGRPLMRQSGGPLYRQGGGSMSDDDVLRQMIMDNLQKPEVQEQAMAQVMGQSGRTTSDRDRAMEELMRYRQIS